MSLITAVLCGMAIALVVAYVLAIPWLRRPNKKGRSGA
jgi:hypothetical protein